MLYYRAERFIGKSLASHKLLLCRSKSIKRIVLYDQFRSVLPIVQSELTVGKTDRVIFAYSNHIRERIAKEGIFFVSVIPPKHGGFSLMLSRCTAVDNPTTKHRDKTNIS